MPTKCDKCGFYIFIEYTLSDQDSVCGCTIREMIIEMSEFPTLDLTAISICATSLGKLSWKLSQFQQIACNEKGSWLSSEEREKLNKR